MKNGINLDLDKRWSIDILQNKFALLSFKNSINLKIENLKDFQYLKNLKDFLKIENLQILVE
ncbi:MAG: hypothetical protein COV98_00950 [Candidatus Altarchaeum sp. CG12_big_fil_rev_8_21_14_0_65_33_22]|nr:MAG: hypothetical protein COV98_00950 [Candidatus Altarchaeum sp. CG12_big_fil_rev_8_21_14_0_65_33_22]PIV27619.1 MAG: hypothetical protein COS36_05135 [Candidatus Altarchaeum sp. CG03_land_8_20_14_0_80_32_618]PIZ31531.1 MAG: hypothetical protein COY41_02425 [Candidatus Altarchaeum sp. CG_4_10_14_0_8_um_filter_32_851]PJC14894.1 MAG: hypothetical protein CO063_02205 [Candidatus Altarchaeum sp. CG_4_9_14_0_8_um_filter_32_206]